MEIERGGERGGDWRVGMHNGGEMQTRWRECVGEWDVNVEDCVGRWRRPERMGCHFAIRSWQLKVDIEI